MTLTITDLVAIYLMFFLMACFDRLLSWFYLQATGKCLLCMKMRVQREVNDDLGVDDEDDDEDDLVEVPA